MSVFIIVFCFSDNFLYVGSRRLPNPPSPLPSSEYLQEVTTHFTPVREGLVSSPALEQILRKLLL